MMPITKTFDTYMLKSPVIKKGEFTDSRGKKLNLTSSMVRDIFNQINHESILYASHSNKKEVGKLTKFILDDDVIYQNSLITDRLLFENCQKNGFNYISPEIYLEEDGDTVKATLDGVALSSYPGMINDKINVERYMFDGQPPENKDVQSDNTTDNSDIIIESVKPIDVSWKEPLLDIKNDIKKLNDKLNDKLSDNKMTEEPQKPTAPEMITMSKSDLENLIKSTISSMNTQQPPEQPIIEQPKPEEPAVVNEPSLINPELQKQIDLQKKANDRILKKMIDNVSVELKNLGVEDVSTILAPNLDKETQLEQLERYKEFLSKKSAGDAPISGSITPPLSSNNDGKVPGKKYWKDVIEAVVPGGSKNEELAKAFRDDSGLFDTDGYYTLE